MMGEYHISKTMTKMVLYGVKILKFLFMVGLEVRIIKARMMVDYLLIKADFQPIFWFRITCWI